MRLGRRVSRAAALAFAGAIAIAAPAAADEVASAAPCSGVDPIRLYGHEAYFEVRRNHTPVGHHRITFAQRDGKLFVEAEFRIAITFLGLTVYRYEYRSEEIWKAGCLQSVKATIDDDGKRWAMTAQGQGGALNVTAPTGSYTLERRVFPTNHWNADVVRAHAVLNTLTGRLNRVRIERAGTETVATGTGPRHATHYRYTGDLQTEIWYDDAGRWVKLRFQGTDGSTVEYVCLRCGPPTDTADRNG